MNGVRENCEYFFNLENNMEVIIMGTYEEFINNILETRGRFECGDEYHERHHIVPKSCNGSDDECNLIDLFAQEHYEAHRLLALENPNNKSLVSAWWLMSHAKGNSKQEWYDVSPEEYEEARIAFVSSISGENNFWYNRITTKCDNCNKEIKVTPYRYNLSNKDGDRRHVFCSAECAYEYKSKYYVGEKHPRYGKYFSEEQKKKISEATKGREAPNKGKPMSEEQKKALSEKTKQRFSNPENRLTGKKNKLSKIINQYDGDIFIQTWYGAKEIQRQLGIDNAQICRCCQHKVGCKSAGGFLWFYADDTDQPDKSKIIPNNTKLIKEVS